jgi:small-conductance mechanosensitive channel
MTRFCLSKTRRQGIRPLLLYGLFLLVLATFVQPAKVLSGTILKPDTLSPSATTNAMRSVDSPAELAAQLGVKLSVARADLARLLGSQTGTNIPPGATPAEAIEYRSLLQRLARTYQLHLEDLSALRALELRQEELNRTIKSWTGFGEPPPYSVLLVDDLRDSIQTYQGRIRAAEVALEASAKFLASAQRIMTESDENVRRLNDQLEGAKDTLVQARLGWQRELEQMRSRVAAATAASFETKRRIANGDRLENRQCLTFAQRRLAITATHVRFSQEDLNRVLDNLATEQLLIEREVQEAERSLDDRQNALVAARGSLQKALQERADGRGEAIDPRRLQAVVEARDIERQTSVQTLTVFRQLLEGIGYERQMWQTRFAVFGSRDRRELQAANRRLRTLSEFMQAAKPHYQQQLELAVNQIAEEQNRRVGPDGAEADVILAQDRIQSYQQREALYLRALQGLEKRSRAVARWQEALDFDRRALPLMERARDLFTEASTFASKFWNLEIFAVEDTVTVDGQPIKERRGVTLGKILTAILILAIGYWISNLVARLLETLARQRLKVEPNQANLIRRWVRVALVFGLVICSLVLVKIPLTIFAFAGGALAIGAGFGMQNLLKNFISGIVILFERPFRVGDVITVDGHSGMVTSIGIRSSIIQLWDSTETLIPNSSLLENNLTNWTYTSRTVRFSVRVGVAYGSDTRRVGQLLAETADRHGLVEKEPKPQVLFVDFGDSTLNFELRYWVDVLKHNAALIASDLRHMINGAFRDNGVTIAFPQQDVHLHTDRPIAVQVASPPPPPAPKSTEPSSAPATSEPPP